LSVQQHFLLLACDGQFLKWAKLDKAKKKVATTFKTNKVWEAQTRALKSLESQIQSLENATKDLKNKIKNDKLDAYYSQSSDCLAYATKVWKSCLRLSELKKLQWELEGRDSTGRKIRED